MQLSQSEESALLIAPRGSACTSSALLPQASRLLPAPAFPPLQQQHSTPASFLIRSLLYTLGFARAGQSVGR